MASWRDVVTSAPSFAEVVQRLFDAHRHKTLATLRKDGSPRISGIEAEFRGGDLWLGSMEGAMKARDLRRDPRMALHSASEDPPEEPGKWVGDAKLSGRAVEITDPAVIAQFTTGPNHRFHLFRIDITEVVLTRPGDPPDHLLIEHWQEGKGLRSTKRY